MKNTLRYFCLSLLLIVFPQIVHAQKKNVTNGKLRVTPADLRAGRTIDLTGEWLYRPGYLLTAGEQPQLATDARGYMPVPVPQLLSRVQWWLDDSEDFKRYEDARLKRLGFDTERAEDGWYQLSFDLPAALPANRRVFVEFDGVAMRSKAFCNAQRLGEHTGMFSRFAYDLTPHLKVGRNTLAVFVSMEKIPTSTLSLGQAVTVNLTASKILTLNKGMFGPLSPDQNNRSYDLHGIWQPVKLVVRDSAMIDDVWFMPSLDGARVQVEARALGDAQRAVIKARWTDFKTGRVFANAEPARVELGSEKKPLTLALNNVQPKLWTPANPNLYRLDVMLESESGELLDEWTRNVGFRTFEARGNKFYLNGKPYWLRGANQLPYGKNSFDPQLPRKLIRLMHDGNQRVTRTHATPWNEAWLNAADEIGLGVSVEGVRPWALAGKIGLPPRDIFEHWLTENEDVIKRARNHPSILLWTVGNELLLRDGKNVEKWKLLSEVVKQTRRLDPFRPVVADSTYQRESDFYQESLKPNNIDDGDVDDVHRYRGWYSDSPFVIDTNADIKNLTPGRPLIGQEMSTGYPDLDTGLPVLRYTRDLLTPQAWVGQDAYPGSEPAVFLEHNRAVTKRWAEQLRFQRGERTAGFLLFSNECWFAHSYDAARVQPYPVYESVRDAWSSVGLAFETGRRRFYENEEVETAIFVTNDDDDFRDHRNLELQFALIDPATKREIATTSVGRIDSLPYYQTARVPVRLRFPQIAQPRQPVQVVVRLLNGKTEISRTIDLIEVFKKPTSANITNPRTSPAAISISLSPELGRFIRESKQFSSVSDDLSAVHEPSTTVILLGENASLEQLKDGERVHQMANDGATVILFSPGKKVQELFPNDVLDTKTVTGEYADLAPAAGTKLVAGLQAMDIKWWGRKNDWRVFVASNAHRLRPNGKARELIRFIPAHSYIPAERVPEQYMTVLFEIPVGLGRVWVCDLDLEESVAVDPAARQLTINLLRAAADSSSTKNLPIVPSHQESLAGRRKSTAK